MKKHFICLANSYKYGGRCLAGVEIEITDNGYSVVRNEDGSPRWIRPVSFSEHGELPANETQNINILDIVEVDVVDRCPNLAHSENIHYSEIEKKSRIVKHKNALNKLCDKVHSKLFFNRGKAIPTDVFNEGNYSLMLIKPENSKIYSDENNKFRVQFTYKDNEYDLPVTDPFYIEKLKSNPLLFGEHEAENLYFALSLGEELDGWHYKLIAGIVDIV